MEKDLTRLEIPMEDFEHYVRLSSLSDNREDDLRRAECLGLGGRENMVAPGAILRIPKEKVGRNIFFGLYTYCNGDVTVEDNVLIGPHCSITAGDHKFDPATGYFSARTNKDYDNSIVIGEGSWLASKVTVTSGVKIGKANLICAGAVVTRSTPDYAIMAGIPAKQVGRIDPGTGEYVWFHHGEKASFPKERTDGRQAFPSPADGATVAETPPTLVWVPLEKAVSHTRQEENLRYRCIVKRKNKVSDVWEEVYRCDTSENITVPDKVLPPGEYAWDVQVPAMGISRGEMRFVVSKKSVPFLRPSVEEVLQGIPQERPRHLFAEKDIPQIVEQHKEELETLRRNIEQAYQDGLPERPMYHVREDALPYREYFGRFRDFCDRNLVACALGYWLLGDEEAGQFAKKLFLHICDWNPQGPCSLFGPWGDEVGLSCARCFPAVYDLLYPLLTKAERQYAGETVAAYALQCEHRIASIHYASNPGNSHVGRLPAYLGEAALSLWGEGIVSEDVLKQWLQTALDIYGSNFPHFGGDDGSWAEGTFYSTSYTKWYLPFFSAVARYSGKNFLERPFYRNYARFLLHFGLPDHEIHPFGDGYWCTPESEEWPGFFAQNPFRIYGEISGLKQAVAYERQLAAPELFALHLLDVFLPKQKYKALADVTDTKSFDMEISDAEAFPDGGYISLHSDHTKPQQDLHLIAHATKYGPGSHRQPDQGSFALFYDGTALLTPSGYFGRAYGTKHHMSWYNSTKAHNAILVDGVGQDYHNFRHTGRIVSCGLDCQQDAGGQFIPRSAQLDLKASYPMLESWTRKLVIENENTVWIEDRIKADHPVRITYPLHMLSQPRKEDLTVTVERKGIEMQIIPMKGCFTSCSLSDRYDVDLNEGEPKEYHVQMPAQYHLYYETESKKEHLLRVKIVVRTI